MNDLHKIRACLHFINGNGYCSQGTHHTTTTYQCDQDALLIYNVLNGHADVPAMPADRANVALRKEKELRPPVKVPGVPPKKV